ncbi:SWIM zinc finger family protein [Haloprofundus salinisoli]|uniref:SWIM zinc finger family protein n=1 Tax=Haloprofundus salinisoli TaxID=2876193 RepID=UPI001CC9857C|nr:SWIM zinc finger family protein [Haloprofundus salinisoli]
MTSTPDVPDTTAESTPDPVDERDVRALTETMFVDREAPDFYRVRTGSGDEYVVDTREPACTCPDFQYRDVRCKHVRRVQFEVGDRDTDTVADDVYAALDDLDDRLAALAARRAEYVGLLSTLERFDRR